ncbi:outer membrane protein assembly factor BamE domain-containing protein [Nitrospina watsonii]|uniref:SmpA_OmlA domain-containing protein n=1 Tax=Nitrospina watsonii TaxID=1323948 RepID=A0ABM9HFN6_9BACT|nr:outer membrane protein assembly factor BamE [Nitrospina watsonii]CAI2719028.1 SmpA_OmlA domain-containing protein [Nitrospina watsonii]
MKINVLFAVLLAGGLTLAGCGSVGHDFDLSQTQHISQGTTTQQDIQSMFGEPFRKGIQNGHPVWVYEKSTYSAIGKDKTKSLIVEFDDQGVVRKYQVMSSDLDK